MVVAGVRKAGPLDTLPPTFAAAGVMSIAVYPVDVVRALCMSSPGLGATHALRGFLDQHGAIGFVKQGMATEVLRSSVARGIKFWLQPIAHQAAFGRAESQGSPSTKAISGVLATVPEVLTISPIENIKLGQQLDKEKRFTGAADVARHLIKTRGVIGGLFCGYFGMQLRQASFTGAFFFILDATKDNVRAAGISNKLAVDVAAGFIAGSMGTLLNTVPDVVRSVSQKKAIADTFDPASKRPSAIQNFLPFEFCSQAAKIHSERGILGLYAGVGPKMVHLGFGGAILAVLMPRFKCMWLAANNLE